MTGSIFYEDLPEDIKHPHYLVAIIRIARLGVDLSCQGKGLGKRLLYDALKKSYITAQSIGVFAIVVDAKGAHAAKFYEQFGFIQLEKNPLTLFVSMKTIGKLFK